jgi:mannose-6-phosphate isomerase-like protein (cupin superfamily)
MKKIVLGCTLAIAAVFWATTAVNAQQGKQKEEPSWAPKPKTATGWKAPMKPHTKFSDIMAKHKGKAEWREPVVRDDHLDIDYVQMAAGGTVSPRFKPDTRSWWVVREGQVRWKIEGQDDVLGTKNSMVQVPAQTIYSMEVVGDKPAIFVEVNIARAKTLYPKSTTPPSTPGVDWLPVVLRRQPQPYGYNNKPHLNLDELAKDPKYRGSRFVHDDRAVSNIIYGRADEIQPYDPKRHGARGHYHPECAELWLIMKGQIMYPMEGIKEPIIASENDIVYAPQFTFHAPRFYGEGFSCRLAMNGYPNIAHLFDAPENPH